MAGSALSRAWPLWVLALIALAAGWLRAPGSAALTSEVAYRARSLELARAGSPLDRDRYLAHPSPAPSPFSPTGTRLLAAVASGLERRLGWTAPGIRGSIEPSDPLERYLLWLPAWCGALACLLLYAALGLGPPGTRAGGQRAAALVAAGLQATLPVAWVAERAGADTVAPLAAALLFGHVRLLRGVLRARDLSDATLAGMLGGGVAGLAVLVSSTAVVTVLGSATWLALGIRAAPAELRADRWRAFGMFAMALLAVLALPPEGASPLSRRLVAGAATSGWWARALLPAAVLLAGLGLRHARRSSLGGAALAAGALLALAAWPLGEGLRSDWREAQRIGRARDDALEWMREGTAPSGPANHGDARQDWGVLAPPAFGGLIAYRGRRPVLAARFGASGPVGGAGVDAPAAVRRAEEALALTDTADFALRLRDLGARYVAVGPTALRGSFDEHDPDSALARLVGAAAYPGLQRVHAADAWCDPAGRSVEPGSTAPGAGPVVSIWRAELPPRAVPKARSAQR